MAAPAAGSPRRGGRVEQQIGEGEVTPAARGRSRRAALRALAGAFPGRVALLAALAVIGGALPAAFAALVARLVDGLPAAVAGGPESDAARAAAGLLAALGGLLVAQEAASAARGLASSDLYRRFDEHLLARVMRAALAPGRLELFEDPALAAKADRAARIARFGPGELVGGLSEQWAARAQGAAAALVVASVWPAAAAGLAALWLLLGRQLQADYYRANPFWSDPLRRARYLKQVALMPAWAKELRVFGLTPWLGGRIAAEWALVMRELWRARRADERATGLLLLAVLAAHALALWALARATQAGALTAGQVALLAQGMLGMAMLADQTGDVWIENGAVPVPDALELERAAAALAGPEGGLPLPAGAPARGVSFEGVRFGYAGRGAPVFDGLDLTIEAGRSLAVVGLNGAGKTTLVKLLAGLEAPQAGRVTVDGVDLASVAPGEWRRAVAAIFQDFVRYELPARDNIGLGAAEALRGPGADDLVLAAARRAGADEVIAQLPAGLDTVLSRRFAGGADLSGGQWQRVALARALAAVAGGARVLVLDEPTAHLDVRAEADLYERFLDLTRGLTTVVISHRFSTVRRADRIVVLDGGRVTEDGTHDELLAAGGQYARLFQRQAARYADGAGGDDGGEEAP